MNIKFYGVRGSYPVPGADTNKYGGNTTCVSIHKEVEGKIIRIIIDCGTGAVALGREIVGNYFAGSESIENMTILFTHLHPDHTQAFPFFAPNYFEKCKIHLMGMKTLRKHIGIVLEQTMIPPTFPIEYKDLKSNRKHYELKDKNTLYFKKDGQFSTTGDKIKEEDLVFKVDVMQAYAPSHPQQGSIYYKITDIKTGKTVSCVWDLESHAGGDKAVINFTKGSDILIHDTQYTNEEYNSDKIVVQGFGHSSYEMAIENAEQAKISGKLICTHYNPSHTDQRLDQIAAHVNKIRSSKKLPFDIILASEGMEISV